MNDENMKKQATAGDPTPETEDTTQSKETPDSVSEAKIFSQGDINRIVQRRLAEERAKADNALAIKEQELAQRELRYDALQMLQDRKLPRQLANLLDYTDKEHCEESIAGIEAMYREAVQAGVEDRLRGTTPPAAPRPAALDTDTIARSAMGIGKK